MYTEITYRNISCGVDEAALESPDFPNVVRIAVRLLRLSRTWECLKEVND